MKIVVFDLDETLGYFTQFGIFWECLSKCTNVSPKYFYATLDLYPEFIRPNIIHILKYLVNQKEKAICNKIMIYTNNQGPKEWVHNIMTYFEDKIESKLFDHAIRAFKIDGKQIEICRNSHNKTYGDLVKCTKIPLNAEVCFVDDTYYPDMVTNNIYYINIKPYYYDLDFDEMITRLKKSKIYTMMEIQSDDLFEQKMKNKFKTYKYQYIKKTKEEHELDEILGKQIMIHLEDFFGTNIQPNNTRKNKKYCKSKTYKSKI